MRLLFKLFCDLGSALGRLAVSLLKGLFSVMGALLKATGQFWGGLLKWFVNH